MVSSVPAWKPQATLAEVTTASSAASAVTSSPRSALRSTGSGIRDGDVPVVHRHRVPELVVERPGVRVVGEDVEADARVALVPAPASPCVHDRLAVALAPLRLVDRDVVDERHRPLDAEPEPADRDVPDVRREEALALGVEAVR